VPSKVVRVSVIDEVVSQLEDAITAGEYPPNTKLPGEAELAAQLDVSRPILREALARLRERGYVRTVNGSGTFTRKPDLDAVSETLMRQIRRHVGTEVRVDDLYELRRTIEMGTARLAAERAEPGDLEALHRHIDAMQAAMDDPEAYSTADARFHLAIAQASHNPLYPLLLAPVVDLVVKSIYQTVRASQDRMQSGINDHIRIVECISNGELDAAAHEIEQHIIRARAMHTASFVETAPDREDGWPRAIRLY
jgi:GntR family transcriptional repressor for pyruvate dehydrogenase complex